MGYSQLSGPVAVVGCGSIGASWAALFAAYGLVTQVYDPNPTAEIFLNTIVEETVKTLAPLGHFTDKGESDHLARVLAKITFTTDLESALEGAILVQENGPEDLNIKLDLLQKLDELLDATVPILASTSGLTCSSMQAALSRFPERFAVGHPFNPPHLIPLVEIVGGKKTSSETLERAKAFYLSVGRKPVVLKVEVPGHIANRLQSALFREIMYMMKEDIASIADIETAMEFGPGLRWGMMGPSALMHLGGGPGGAEYYAEKLLSPLLTWNAPGDFVVDEEAKRKWVAQTLQVVGNESYVELSRKRDAAKIEVYMLSL
ncbi:3-hydroxyacyl-CoA dehydrogenase, NAD binding domain containing protein [Hyaloscypha variabilis]